MQEMTITSVHALGPRYAVILKEKDADRYLPILVGASDANAIAIKLHNPQVSLNLTHDLLCTVIDALGGSVRQVLINRDCPDQTDSSNHVTLWDGSNYKPTFPIWLKNPKVIRSFFLIRCLFLHRWPSR